MSKQIEAYRSVDEAVGWIDRSARARLEIKGPDAAKFLHNLTTNEVKRLPRGRGCEAFVTSPQGKALAYVSILATADSLLVRADPDGLTLALPHFQKYGVFDDVTFEDRGRSSREFHLAGPDAERWIVGAGGAAPEAAESAFVETRVHGVDVLCVREHPTGRPGLTLIGFGPDASRIGDALRNDDGGAVEIDPDTFEALRIEAGTPVFGREATERNLPQEIGRDDRAISFVKGCYLGQETVARLDALGHVNQILKGLLFEPGAPPPPAGAALEADGKRVGAVASAAFSPGWNAWVGLGLIRVPHAAAGTVLSWRPTAEDADASVDAAPRAATVRDLPSLPPRDAAPAPRRDGR